jgi:hypothetical protein
MRGERREKRFKACKEERVLKDVFQLNLISPPTRILFSFCNLENLLGVSLKGGFKLSKYLCEMKQRPRLLIVGEWLLSAFKRKRPPSLCVLR